MKNKNTRHTSSKTKTALIAGAAALTALATQSQAQTSVDALLNKLEQKGVLSADETKALRDENALDSKADFDAALNQKFPIAPWVKSYKLSGDFRARYDGIMSDNSAQNDRNRFRYRLRFGITASLMDNLEAGFRLGSGDSGGNPLSNNTTMENNGTKKPIWVDAAYGKWTAVNNGDLLLAATVGKMNNPFNFTPMVLDPDLTPEGLALDGHYNLNDKHNLSYAGGIFVLDESSTSTHDPMLYGGQVAWNAKWNSKLDSSVGVGALVLGSPGQLTTANVPYGNQGNTRTAGGVLAHDYNPVIGDASVTYSFDKFPLYEGAFPVKLAGEYIYNPAAAKDNTGFWAGVTFGKSGKKHTWDLSYRYEYLGADAWYDQLVDDDNGVFYQNAPTAGKTGFLGGTNVKGHLVKFNYSITDSLTFTATCYINDLIHQANEPQSMAYHFMADVMWKF